MNGQWMNGIRAKQPHSCQRHGCDATFIPNGRNQRYCREHQRRPFGKAAAPVAEPLPAPDKQLLTYPDWQSCVAAWNGEVKTPVVNPDFPTRYGI